MIVNGVGATLRTGRPNTIGGVIYTRNTYNAKGQLTKEQTCLLYTSPTGPGKLWLLPAQEAQRRHKI